MPIDRQSFLSDQRKQRRRKLDKLSSVKIQQNAEETVGNQTHSSIVTSIDIIPDEIPDVNANYTHSEQPGCSIRSRYIENDGKQNSYNTVKLFHVAQIADRYNVSDRVAAALATAALVDFGLITADDKNNVIDRSKIRRAREKARKIQVSALSFEGICGLYFDGKKNKETLVSSGKAVKEEHISFIEEPKSNFIGHKKVDSGASADIVKSIEELLEEKSIQISRINAIGCDGTNTNTGVVSGIIRRLELKWKKPLQWDVCMLHMNELPVKWLIEGLDGPTTGPNSYSGPIGARLKNCEEQPIVEEFQTIPFVCDLNDIENIAHTLSTDQKTLIDLCTAVATGEVYRELQHRPIGKLSHARWTTTASRVLRVYMSDECPSEELKCIVKYILYVYVPSLFEIKHKPSIVFGPIHLAKMLKSTRLLPLNARVIVQQTIQRNAYFAHPEHIVLAMLNDDNMNIRRSAWLKILRAREAAVEGDRFRVFAIPELNFNCTNYLRLVKQNFGNIDPPVLRDIPVNETDIDLLSSERILQHEFGVFLKDMPSHTQAVERCVQMVTDASKKVSGEERRDGFIANKIASRNMMPTFDSKKQFEYSEYVPNHLSV